MGKIVQKNQPCLNPKCTSSDGRQIYEDGDSFCFSCNKFFPPGYNGETVSKVPTITRKQTNTVSLEDIEEFEYRGFADRKVTKVISEFYKVKVSYGTDGQIDTHYYPYESGSAYKVRNLPKTFYWLNKSTSLFGKELFPPGGKRVILCEGEIDTMSVALASYDRYGKFYPVVGLSSSVMAKNLLEHRDWLRSFKEVVLCFDMDKAGEDAVSTAVKIIGVDKVKIVSLPLNDANEVLKTEDGSKVLMQCIFEAKAWAPAGIISKEDIWTQMQERNKIKAIPYPPCLAGLNTKLKGRRRGEITLFISGTGCLAKGTKVLMFDGSLKAVEDIRVGEQVMGDDSTCRNVMSLKRGFEQMYRVSIRGNESFVCNESHVLSVVNNDTEGRWGLAKNQVVDVTVHDYLKWSDKRKHLSKAFKAGPLNFKEQSMPIFHPYMLGVWLGDGYSDGARLSNESDEIIGTLVSMGVPVVKHKTKYSWGLGQEFLSHLQRLNLIKNKHIPEEYLRASYSDRLALLAGLLDTDGSLNSENCYEFSQKSELITDQVIRLTNSLGFQATKSKQVANKFGNCFRVFISGDGLEKIPVSLPRKRASPRGQIKNPLRFKMNIEKLAIDNYYGFEVDGNNRFVLGNFIVTHNSGKSTIVREIIVNAIDDPDEKVGVISLEESPGETGMKLSGMAIHRNPANEEIDEIDLRKGFDKIFGDDQVIVLDHQGSIKDESIIDQLEYMCLMGCKTLLIDHITILVSEGADGLSGNEAIDKIMNDLLRLVKRHDVWIGLVSHLRKVATGGKSFEEGRLPTMDDIRGSGSIKQVSFDIVAFSRNMMAAIEAERNTILMAVLKSRTMGLTGIVQGSVYDQDTGRLSIAEFDESEDTFTKLT